MNLVIRRCVKKPGLIDRARTFRLEYAEQGLFVVYLGPATGEFRKFPGLLEKAISDAALSYFGNRYEQQHAQSEEELARVGLAGFMAKPHCTLVPAGASVQTTFFDAEGAVLIKHAKLKLKLFMNPSDYQVMKEIRGRFPPS